MNHAYMLLIFQFDFDLENSFKNISVNHLVNFKNPLNEHS